MISVLKSTTRRHAREKARSSSSTAAATAAVGTGVVKNSSVSNSNNSSNHIQNTGDDAAFGGLNHLTGSYEKASFKHGRRIMQNSRNSHVMDLGAGHVVGDFISSSYTRYRRARSFGTLYRPMS